MRVWVYSHYVCGDRRVVARAKEVFGIAGRRPERQIFSVSKHTLSGAEGIFRQSSRK